MLVFELLVRMLLPLLKSKWVHILMR